MSDGLRGRLAAGFFSLVAVFAAGTFGYYLLGDGQWRLADCFYMTVITLTTVGYSEFLPGFAEVPYARTFTIGLIVIGIGVFVYFASTLTAFIVEGELRRALQSSRMRKRLARMKNHIIVCGVGATGRHVVKELMATGTPMVAIDTNEECLRDLAQKHGEQLVFVVGDATDDSVLDEAGLDRARGLVATLASDKDNLYLVVSARQRYPDRAQFRIVARGTELSVLDKLERAGANSVVSPNFIGGMRMASEILRPAVVEFLDVMMRDTSTMRIEEVSIRPGSELAGHTMRQLDLRNRIQVSILAIRNPGSDDYHFNPGADVVLEPGMTLVVLGAHANMDRLRAMAR